MTDLTTPLTDEWLQHAVLAELKREGRVPPNAVGVTVGDGVVTLTGHLDSYDARVAAEEAAHRVHGVRAVANDVEVRLPVEAERSDADLAIAVTHALEWEAGIPLQTVELTVTHGWVTVKGAVNEFSRRETAARAVRRVAGVRGVTNLLT